MIYEHNPDLDEIMNQPWYRRASGHFVSGLDQGLRMFPYFVKTGMQALSHRLDEEIMTPGSTTTPKYSSQLYTESIKGDGLIGYKVTQGVGLALGTFGPPVSIVLLADRIIN